MDNKILEKIKKCLALAESDNANEAASAFRQAQKLMAKHDLNATDLELSTVKELEARGATRASHLPKWVSLLRFLVGSRLGVETLNSVKRVGMSRTHVNAVRFVGRGEKPEAAQYAYEVLFRQITADRKAFFDGLTARDGSIAQRTKLADLFCETWVKQVARKVEAYAMTDEDTALVNAYKEKTYGDRLERSKTRSTTDGLGLEGLQARSAGARAGDKANLFRGVSTKAKDQQLN